ncbi:MAG TPA: MATE family efflux transporter [Bacillota bacterium]|nr:MATE family efflux transporter [Bacillota bacterium]
MHKTERLKDKFKLFITILVPILITQVILSMMNFVDTVMSGRAGATDLAGVAIGSSIWMPVFTGINGILIAVTPIIAQYIGAQKTDKIATTIKQAVYLAILLAITVIAIGSLLLNPILNLMDLEDHVHYTAKYYLVALGAGIVPQFVFTTLRSVIDAHGKTRLTMIIILIALPLNVFLNYVFIFGNFGVPAYGGVGSGIATAISFWAGCFIAIFVVYKNKPFQQYNLLTNWVKPSLNHWKEQLKIGVPTGFAIFFETSIFAAVTLLMSAYSTYTIAAHQAAINFVSLLYMVPLSVGMTLTIAIGYEVGARRFYDARSYGYLGISSGIFIAVFSGIILFIFNDFVASLYSNNPDVIRLIKQFIYYAIIFQIADAFGAPIQGALRGYKDVNITLVIALISYWGIGLPTGYVLANYTALEPFGYWIGLIVGLGTGAIALFTRLMYVQKTYTKYSVTAVDQAK